MLGRIFTSFSGLSGKTVRCIRKSKLHTLPDFTKNSYDVHRGPYNSLDECHIDFFRNLLGANGIIMDLCDLEKYNVDFWKFFRGNSSLVLRPRTTEEVSKILAYCNKHRLAVCPQGGNTSVCGGSVPIFDEIIISTELMNNILHLDEFSGALTCEAGCVLQNLESYLNEKDLRMPLDLGSKGSCQIGGNVSTNAGGIRLFRYGSLQENVLGLEVVKGDGEVLDCLGTLKKDNSGFHLKHLFIGAEGCLGFITKVAIQCPPQPKSLNLSFMGVQNFEKALKSFKKAKQDLGEILSAVEIIDHATMELVEEHSDLSSPIGHYPAYFMIETAGSNEEHDQEKLHKYFKECIDQHFVLNGLVESSPAKIKKLWSIREKIAENFKKDGYVHSFDLTLPFNNFFGILDEMKEYVKGRSHRVFGFGHMGDGNLHVQISTKQFSSDDLDYIEPYLYKRVRELNGSISSEHGIGFRKQKYLPMVKSEAEMTLMRNLKKIMDPNGILNPYKVI